jgi:tRNA1(Val) A37 N6-methylase TrmN6
MNRTTLTTLAQARIAQVLAAGERAIDATAGNGHDTLFLARQVGAEGRVLAFDVQAQALANTARRLHEAGLSERVELIAEGHEHLASQVPATWHGSVGAVMFNLGYLPGGDRTRITRPTTTLAALDQATRLLRPAGVITLLVYRGHAGGDDEHQAVVDWLADLPAGFIVLSQASPGPVMYTIERQV